MEINQGEKLMPNSFQAWQYSPVHPVAYHEFKKYGASRITGRSVNPFTGEPWSISNKNRDIVRLIKEVISLYGNLTGPQMSHLTHKPDTPWRKTWRDGIGKDQVISSSDILSEFQKIRQESPAYGRKTSPQY
jgi:uncharacterized phage-associated protein